MDEAIAQPMRVPVLTFATGTGTMRGLYNWSEPLRANQGQSQLPVVAAWISSNAIGGR